MSTTGQRAHTKLNSPRARRRYLGLSWASGLGAGGVANPNGQNQESSSEAVHAYAALHAYLDVASLRLATLAQRALSQTPDEAADFAAAAYLADAATAARRGRAHARLLASSEIAAAGRYWHVLLDGSGSVSGGGDNARPAPYGSPAVGIVWSNGLAQFQTCVGRATQM